VALVVAGAALMAGPAVAWAFGPGPLLPDVPLPAPLVVAATTALWAWVLCRRLLVARSLWHFLWLGPLFGVLNAGTALALLSFDSFPFGPLTGLLFGMLVGSPVGATLGLVFGGLIARFVAYHRKLLGKEPSDAGLRLMTAGAVWLLVVALAVHGFAREIGWEMAQLEHLRGTPLPWEVAGAEVASKFLATFVVLVSLVLHLKTLRWSRSVRSGGVPLLAVKPAAELAVAGLPPLAGGPASEVLVRRESAGSGPFRHGSAHAPLTYLASDTELRTRTAVAATLAAATSLLWLF